MLGEREDEGEERNRAREIRNYLITSSSTAKFPPCPSQDKLSYSLSPRKMDALPHQAQSLYHESTVESADSIESHPSLAGVFALGTYQVDQQEQPGGEDVGSSSRAGVDDEEQGSSTSPEYSRRGTLRLKRVRKAGNIDGRGLLGSLSWCVVGLCIHARCCSADIVLALS